MTDLEARGAEPLVDANVNVAQVGERWPIALCMLIEAHEKRYGILVKRREIHVLLDRYAARFFPDAVIEHEHRRAVIRTLQERYYGRFTVWLHRRSRLPGE